MPTPGPAQRTLRSVRQHLVEWWAAHGRTDLAFRRSREPWPVLVAEVMLQQTQAGRIHERFDAFLDRFPSPEAMAAATPAEVLVAWSGLGYNRRALALHRAAQALAIDGWPATVAGLERLPGIGPYSARAIASIAFGQPVGVVDTNVRRWLTRRFAADPGDTASLQRLADRLAVLPPGDPGSWTHATMEFGARICTARSPHCPECPVARGCPSRQAPARVPVSRQNAATAAGRAARGTLLAQLVAAPDHRLRRPRRDAVAAALVRDGLAHRSGRDLVLGPMPEGSGAPGTIGP